MKIGEGVNEYGTPISKHICDECGAEFTVCPPANDHFGGCMAAGCTSYDPARDADKMWDENPDAIIAYGNQKHDESEKCWCEPDVEEQPNGAKIIIHKRPQ